MPHTRILICTVLALAATAGVRAMIAGDIEIRLLGIGDEAVLDSVAEEVFDHAINPNFLREYLAEPHFHLAVAVDAGIVVGMASAVDYIHPDKPRELRINEVGVAASHRGRGIAKRLLHALFAHGRELRCRQAWVLTNRSNAAAMRLYASLGGIAKAADTMMFEFEFQDGDADATQ